MRVLLISPPLSEPAIPNLAIELLAVIARKAGHHADTLHGALHQPRSQAGAFIHALFAPVVYVPYYYDLDPVDVVGEAVAALRADQRRAPSPEADDVLAEALLFAVNEAELCLARLLDEIPAGRYDVIGLSVGFDSQKLPAAALAKGLRARGERALVVVGGTGTDGTMGPALLETFQEFDLVLQGEADRSWPQLLERAANGAHVETVPGCVYRQGGRAAVVPEEPVRAGTLDSPWPDYASFIRQRSRSQYSSEALYLLFESSRGCWWGRHKHCTFCGIKSVDMAYRVRDEEDTADLLTALYDRYRPDVLYASDAIAPTAYGARLWHRLAKLRSDGRDWTIFYEGKTSAKPSITATMAAAGITRMQPGIESFSTHVLQLMDKGATALRQVAFLKWAQTYGITLTYGVIVGTPGETPTDLEAMARLLTGLHHLQPPGAVNHLGLHRFSPHFNDPRRYGIEDVRPFALQRVIYRCSDERRERLCYELTFRVPEHDRVEYRRSRDLVRCTVAQWQAAYQQGASLWQMDLGLAHLIGRGTSAALHVEVIEDPIEQAVLRECVDVRSWAGVTSAIDASPEAVAEAGQRLESRGLLLLADGEALALPIPMNEGRSADRRALPDRASHVLANPRVLAESASP